MRDVTSTISLQQVERFIGWSEHESERGEQEGEAEDEASESVSTRREEVTR
jgi:hypothetical protein